MQQLRIKKKEQKKEQKTVGGGQDVLARAEAKCPGQGPSAVQLCARCGRLPSRVLRILQRPTAHAYSSARPLLPCAGAVARIRDGVMTTSCSAVQVLAVVQQVSPRVPISVLRAWQHLRYFSAPLVVQRWRVVRCGVRVAYSRVCDMYTHACVNVRVRAGGRANGRATGRAFSNKKIAF